jgi:uncharacterized protein with FMN-binding domain
MASQNYKDGEYTVTGFYSGEKKNIIVKMGLKDGKIASVAVTPTATIKLSLGLQKKFALAIADEVVGRSIDEVYLDKLAGSSLTTKGFNDAIEKIKAEAAK